MKYSWRQLKYSKILKKEICCFCQLSSENYVSDNKIYIGGSKHEILSIENAWREGEENRQKFTVSQKNWCR